MLSTSGSGDTYDAIGPVEGPLAGVWRRPRRTPTGGGVSFGASWHVASGSTASFAVYHLHDGVFDERIYVGSLEDIGGVEVPAYVLDTQAPGRGIQRMWVNDDYLLAELQPDLSLYMWRLDQEDFQVVDEGAVPGIPQNEALVGDHVLWEAWASSDETRLAIGGWDLTSRAFVDIDPSDTKSFATDGIDMAWLELHDRDPVTLEYGRMELWTMPYAAEPDRAGARLVDPRFPVRTSATVGGGWYVFDQDIPGSDVLGQVIVLPLDGGPRRFFRPPDGANVNGVLYVDATNLFVRSGPDVYWVDPRELPEL